MPDETYLSLITLSYYHENDTYLSVFSEKYFPKSVCSLNNSSYDNVG